MTINHPSIDAEIRATRALIKFWEEHGGTPLPLVKLNDCLRALETYDLPTVFRINHELPTGRMGSFDDWIPDPVFDHETDEYVWAVFEALVIRWKLRMNLLEQQRGS